MCDALIFKSNYLLWKNRHCISQIQGINIFRLLLILEKQCLRPRIYLNICYACPSVKNTLVMLDVCIVYWCKESISI